MTDLRLAWQPILHRAAKYQAELKAIMLACNPISALLLRRVEALIRPSNECLNRLSFAVLGHTDRYGNSTKSRSRRATHDFTGGDAPANVLRRGHGLRQLRGGKNDHEFLSTVARHNSHGFSRATGDRAGNEVAPEKADHLRLGEAVFRSRG